MPTNPYEVKNRKLLFCI